MPGNNDYYPAVFVFALDQKHIHDTEWLKQIAEEINVLQDADQIPGDCRKLIQTLRDDTSEFCFRIGKSVCGDANAWCATYKFDKQKMCIRDRFIFYTNYESRKGRQLAQNPYISLSFVWHELERQVHIEGTAAKVSPEESDEYFRKRPYKSRIGARTVSYTHLDVYKRQHHFYPIPEIGRTNQTSGRLRGVYRRKLPWRWEDV